MLLFSNKSITINLTITMALLISAVTEASSETSTEMPNHISQSKKVQRDTQQTETKLHPVLQVYKSPTCSCCEKWLDHLEQQSFISKAHNQASLSAFKTDKGIAPQYRSCHTAVSKEGYVFEGHVPAKFIHQFLASPPKNAIGLAVPGMPVGSPGMEVGDKFMPYQVILLKADSSYEVYAELNNYQEQF